MPNPWLDLAQSVQTAPTPAAPSDKAVQSPAEQVVIPPESGPQASAPALFVLGVTGGAGESSLARLHPDWAEAGHTWPVQPAAVLLAARTSAAGLLAAAGAVAQWASGEVPHIRLVGIALVADAPGKLPPSLIDLRRHVIAGVDRHWDIGWSPEWRLGDPEALAPGCDRLLRDLVPRS